MAVFAIKWWHFCCCSSISSFLTRCISLFFCYSDLHMNWTRLFLLFLFSFFKLVKIMCGKEWKKLFRCSSDIVCCFSVLSFFFSSRHPLALYIQAEQINRHIFVKGTWSKTISTERHGLFILEAADFWSFLKKVYMCFMSGYIRMYIYMCVEIVIWTTLRKNERKKDRRKKMEWEIALGLHFEPFVFCHLVPHPSCFIIYMLVSTPFEVSPKYSIYTHIQTGKKHVCVAIQFFTLIL